MKSHLGLTHLVAGLALSPWLVIGLPQTSTNDTLVDTTGNGTDTTTNGTTTAGKTSLKETSTLVDSNNDTSTANDTTPLKTTQLSIKGVTMKLAADVSGAWKTLTCDDPVVVNLNDYTAADRWTKLDINDAWDSAVAAVKTANNVAQLSWVELMSNFFHGPENMACGVLNSRNQCYGGILCLGPPQSYVPMFEILNSFSGVADMNWNIYDALGGAESAVTTQIGEFTSTFAPIDDTEEALKIILDLVGLGFALAVSPLWNSVFKAIPFFKANGNTLGTIKDSVNPLVSNGITLIKDSGVLGQSINAQNTLEKNMGNLVTIWGDTLSQINAGLFAGTDDSVNQLHGIIDSGKALTFANTTTAPQATISIEQAIFAYMVPKAWSLSNKDIHPVIATSGASCGSKDNVDSKYLNAANVAATSSCVNGKLYHLLSVSGQACIPPPVSNPHGYPTCKQFLTPPGYSSLTGKETDWGGLTKDQLTSGAVATYVKAGNKNGGTAIDITNAGALDDIFNNGIEAAGIVYIPVCSFDEAYNNWQKLNTKAPNYPCN